MGESDSKQRMNTHAPWEPGQVALLRRSVESGTYRGSKPKGAIGTDDVDPCTTQRFKTFSRTIGGRVIDDKDVCPGTLCEEHRST
jgi:hypothetical protein